MKGEGCSRKAQKEEADVGKGGQDILCYGSSVSPASTSDRQSNDQLEGSQSKVPGYVPCRAGPERFLAHMNGTYQKPTAKGPREVDDGAVPGIP